QTGQFKKTWQDDLKSMLQGIANYKGRIHFAMGTPLAELLNGMEMPVNKNDLVKRIAELIDQEIYARYHLWPTNYVAYDLIQNSDYYADKYTADEKAHFLQHIDKLTEKA